MESVLNRDNLIRENLLRGNKGTRLCPTAPFAGIPLTLIFFIAQEAALMMTHFPSPYYTGEPDQDHVNIALAIDQNYRSSIAINPDARLDLEHFVFRGSVNQTVFQKSQNDTRYHHRNPELTSFYASCMDFHQGDEVIQVGQIGLFSYPKYHIKLFAKRMFRRLHCRLIVSGYRHIGYRHAEYQPVRLPDNCLIVSNHLSYLDIPMIASLLPGCFVTSREIQKIAFLGHLTQLAGCLFVERRSRLFLKNETRSLSHALKQGLNVVLFPEGTSSNGDGVLRFRQPLFQAAFDAGKPVLPVSIRYTRIGGNPFAPSNRDQVCWYDDMAFWPHFKNLANLSVISVNIHIHPLVYPEGFSGPKELSRHCHNLTARTYRNSGF